MCSFFSAKEKKIVILTQSFVRSHVICQRLFEVGGGRKASACEFTVLFFCILQFVNGCVGRNVSW